MKPSPEDIIQAVYDAAEKALRVRAGVPEHHNGEAPTTPEEVTFSSVSRHVVLRSAQPGQSLMVSFDDGDEFLTVPPGETLDLDCAVDHVVLKGSVAPVSYECLVVV